MFLQWIRYLPPRPGESFAPTRFWVRYCNFSQATPKRSWFGAWRPTMFSPVSFIKAKMSATQLTLSCTSQSFIKLLVFDKTSASIILSIFVQFPIIYRGYICKVLRWNPGPSSHVQAKTYYISCTGQGILPPPWSSPIRSTPYFPSSSICPISVGS